VHRFSLGARLLPRARPAPGGDGSSGNGSSGATETVLEISGVDPESASGACAPSTLPTPLHRSY